MRTSPYSKFLTNIASLIGVEENNLQTAERAILNTFFNKNLKYAWQQTNWIDLCPYGEYVSANNLLNFPNTFQNQVWGKHNITVAPNAMPNAISGNVDAARLTTTGTNAYLTQSFTPVSLYQNYFGVWLRASTNADVPVQAVRDSDGTVIASITYSLTNVWQFCLLPYTPIDLTSHSVRVGGSNALSAGLTFFCWQAAAVDVYSVTGGIIIPYSQIGNAQIDIPITLWKDSPFNPQPPRRVGYRLTDQGIKVNDQATNFIVNNNFVFTTNTATLPIPVYYLYYRKQVPDFTGNDYSGTATYAVSDQVVFTYSNGYKDYWQCVAATTAGQSPESAPNNWFLLEIPYAFMDYCVYASYVDWLIVEGQNGKAQIMTQVADTILTKELERQELQMGVTMPTRVATHVTSQAYY